MDKKVHKRFLGFCITSGLLIIGALSVDASVFPVFAQMVSASYVVYLGGQSATDYVKAKNGTG